MNTDEIEAFKTASAAAQARGLLWRPPYSIALDEDEWQVKAESECHIRISRTTGEVIPDVTPLDPVMALTAAREYALKNSLRWKATFTLVLESDCWEVGSCQNQFGGQTYIYVSHKGDVTRHWVNGK